jgi:hypothetical protein
MTSDVHVKHYSDPRRCAWARIHLGWLAGLDSGVRLPAVRSAGTHRLVFEHLGHRRPGPGDLHVLADALGRLHAAAYTRQLHAARLDQPFRTPGGLVISDFVTPRREILRRLRVPVTGLPAAVYKDANIRNFLLTDTGVAILDFDDLTLAPFGYDLAKLVLSTAMTHGHLDPRHLQAALEAYNARTAEAGGHTATCTPQRLRGYAEVHHLLTARYLHRNGYTHPWPEIRPWRQPDPPP